MQPLKRLLVCCCILCCTVTDVPAVLLEPMGTAIDARSPSQVTVQINQQFRVFGTRFPSGTTIYANYPVGQISINASFSEDSFSPSKGASMHLLQPFETTAKSVTKAENFYWINFTATNLFEPMNKLVRANFWQKSNFSAVGGYLFTWQGVRHKDSSEKNQFQAALFYDESSTYVLYNYDTVTKLDFVSSSSVAMAGFSNGNSKEMALLPFSGSLKLQTASGTADGINGRFIYRVDTWPPLRGGCLSEDPTTERDRTFVSTVTQDSVLGGSLAIISTRCPKSGDEASCQATLDGQQVASVAATPTRSTFWACKIPALLRAGTATLTLKIGPSVNYTSDFRFVSPDDASVTGIVLHNSIDNWMQTEPATLMIAYDANTTLNGALKLQVIGYSEAGLVQISEEKNSLTKVLLEITASSAGTMDLIAERVRCPAGNTDCESYHIGYLQIVDSSTPANSIRSRIIPLGWFVHQYYLGKQSPKWFEDKCKSWYDASKGNDKVREELSQLACPSTLIRAQANPSQYLPRTYCPTVSGGCKAPKQLCFVSRPLSSIDIPGIPAAVCCYNDPAGNLLFQEMMDESNSLTQYGSTSLRSHPNGQPLLGSKSLLPGQVSYMSHWYWDILSNLYCCQWAKGGRCQMYYMQSRPTPVNARSQAVKDQALGQVLRVLMHIRGGQVDACVASLPEGLLDVLMKYIYRGFEVIPENHAHLLTWHEKTLARGQIGCVVRVLADRKRV